METEKRKRQDENDGEMHKKRTKGEGVNGEQTVAEDEDEVEEFFAILRRIHVAVKYFEKGNGERGKLTEERWRPSFEAEDFDDVDGVNDDEINKSDNKSRKHNGDEKEEAVEKISGFDLNSDPAFSPSSSLKANLIDH